MKKLTRVLAAAAIGMLVMTASLSGALAADPVRGSLQTSVSIANSLTFFSSCYDIARSDMPGSNANPNHGKIYTVEVKFFNGDNLLKTADLTKINTEVSYLPQATDSGAAPTRVEIHVKLVGVSKEIVKTVDLEENVSTKIVLDAKPVRGSLYQIDVRTK